MEKTVKYVGLDVHKNFITVAVADQGRNAEVRIYGDIAHDLDQLDKVTRKLVSSGAQLYFVYEAGPCGYQIYRHLISKGFNCIVTSPATIPRKSSDRIKTDRRDAAMLARLHRSGELTAVYVPNEEDQAMRDLTRAREDARYVATKAKQRLNAFLLRNGFVYSGKSHWGKAHWKWIADLKMPHSAQYFALEEYVNATHQAVERIDRLVEQIRQLCQHWRLAPVVTSLQAARGISLVTAATIIAELGDLNRFEHPSQLMAYLGLVPSEHSSGPQKRKGGITKTGNGHVRRVLVEAAWSYRLPARVSSVLLKRQHDVSQPVCQIAWKAQLRLCARFRAMRARGKSSQVVTTAIARELIGFLWAIAKHVPVEA